jgi:hypothetical protein
MRITLYSYAVLIFFGFHTICSGAQQTPSMEASVTYSEIFLGETVHLMLHVHGYQPSFGEPDLTGLDAETQLIGQQDRSQQSIQVINGIQKVQTFSGRIFTYRIRPNKVGTFQFAPIILRGPNNQPIPVNTPSVMVREIPVQDIVNIQIQAPTNQIIPDETFEISLQIDIRKPPVPYQSYSPIPNGTHPHLHIPFLQHPLQQGLQSQDITQLMQGMLVGEGEAFRINDQLLERDPFGGMFGRDQAALFRLPRSTPKDNPAYYRYTLTTDYTADREGDFQFGPVRFRGKIITNVTATGRADVDSLYAISPSAIVHVRNPPAQGRPATYLGASGSRLAIETSLDTQNCLTGDPVTLTIEVTGDGPIQRIRNPRPATFEPLAEDFRMQEEPTDTEIMQHGKRFSYLIRPKHPGTLEVPALRVSFFDLTSRTYRTVQSDPLPIRVNPNKELLGDSIANPTQGRIKITMSAISGNRPPAPFAQEKDKSRQTIFHPIAHIVLLLLGPMFLICSFAGKWVYKSSPAIQRARKRKVAYVHAIQTLSQSKQDPGMIIREYLADMLNPCFLQGNAESMQQALHAGGIQGKLYKDTMKLITEDAYTGKASSSENNTVAREVLHNLCVHFKKTRKQGKLRFSLHPQIWLILLLCPLLPLQANDVGEFEKKRSNQLILEGQETKDFLIAADALAARVSLGSRDPIILYNLGTALLMAEQPVLALPILQWSERRGAPAWNVRRNILVAQRMISQNPAQQLSWIRKLLFWHYGISVSTRISILLTLFTMIWIASTMRWLWKWPIRMMPLLYILLSFIAISVAASLYAEYQDEQDWPMQHDKIQRILNVYEKDRET